MDVRVFGNYLQHIPKKGPERYVETPYYKKHANLILEKRVNCL
jgi:hypothetical protein